jgi:DNA-directed RNA polymerase subunit M/transcription elongation factor TFIIS
VSSLIGKDIEAHCTKCKSVLNHIILIDVNNIVSKVKCKTCGSEHKYRGPKSPKKKSSPSPNPYREKYVKLDPSIHKRNSTAPAQWEHKKNEMKPNHLIKIYRTQDTFQLKDVIQHHAFGLGFVEQIISNTRMDVLFCDAIKRMVMNTELL